MQIMRFIDSVWWENRGLPAFSRSVHTCAIASKASRDGAATNGSTAMLSKAVPEECLKWLDSPAYTSMHSSYIGPPPMLLGSTRPVGGVRLNAFMTPSKCRDDRAVGHCIFPIIERASRGLIACAAVMDCITPMVR